MKKLLCFLLAALMLLTLCACGNDKVRGKDEDEVDYDALEEWVEWAEDLNEEDFSAESWAKLEEALEEAEDALDSDSQRKVDKALVALHEAIEGLMTVDGESPDLELPEDGPSFGGNKKPGAAQTTTVPAAPSHAPGTTTGDWVVVGTTTTTDWYDGGSATARPVYTTESPTTTTTTAEEPSATQAPTTTAPTQGNGLMNDAGFGAW